MTWKKITDSFNGVMPENRKRSMYGLKYIWKKSKDYYLPPNQSVTTKILLITHCICADFFLGDSEHVYTSQRTI